jgi:hypothetical protein
VKILAFLICLYSFACAMASIEALEPKLFGWQINVTIWTLFYLFKTED